MAKKIDEATILKINEVYAECGVKTKTAQVCGVSVASVNKYLIPDFKTKRQLSAAVPKFEGTPKGIQSFIDYIKNFDGTPAEGFCRYCIVTPEEWDRVKEIQKGILI